jgi:hypothetical protein
MVLYERSPTAVVFRLVKRLVSVVCPFEFAVSQELEGRKQVTAP